MVTFSGRIIKGKFRAFAPESLRAWLSDHEGQIVRIKVGEKTRSGAQNAYYWGVVIPEMASHAGCTENEMHDWLKEELLPPRFVTVNGKEHRRQPTTTTLTTQQFSEYVERVRLLAAEFYGVCIDDPI